MRNKVIDIIILIALTGLWAGCGHNAANKSALDKKVVMVQSEQKLNTQKFITGTVDALAMVPATNRVPAVVVAERLAMDAQNLLGLPPVGERLNVPAMVSTNKVEVKQEEAKVVALEKNSIALRKQLDDLEARLKKAEDNLIAKGVVKEQEDNSNLIHKVIAWCLATLGVGGTIALVVFCPAVLPVIGQLLAWIVSTVASIVPQVVSFFGIVGSSLVQNISTGISDFKNALKAAPPGAKFSVDEILAMHDKALHDSNDTTGRKVLMMFDTKNRKAKVAEIAAQLNAKAETSDLPHPTDIKL